MNYSNKVYWAHSMQMYKTEEEEKIRAELEGHGFNILCPSRDLKIGNDMDDYLKIVRQCQMVIVSEYAGFIGKGVYLEVKHAIRHKIPTLVYREGILLAVKRVKEFNIDDHQTTYGQIKIYGDD